MSESILNECKKILLDVSVNSIIFNLMVVTSAIISTDNFEQSASILKVGSPYFAWAWIVAITVYILSVLMFLRYPGLYIMKINDKGKKLALSANKFLVEASIATFAFFFFTSIYYQLFGLALALEFVVFLFCFVPSILLFSVAVNELGSGLDKYISKQKSV
jgi:hypothetical protein